MMQAGTTTPDPTRPSVPVRWPLRAIAASLALHALLAVLVITLSSDRAFSPQRPTTIQVQLLEPEPSPTPAPEPEPEPEQAPAALDSLAITAAPDDAGPAPSPTPDVSVGEDESEPGPRLAEEILRTIERQSGSSYHLPQREFPWSRRGDPLPGLPGMRGWIAAYAGTVTPQADSWQNNDGSKSARYVLADGTVICTSRRAPTIDEMMNPWKSLAVTMARFCGRERPAPVDYSNPRVQPPPGAAGRPADSE